MPSPNDPGAMKKVHAGDTEYKLADSDDETDDTVETRRSVQWAENELKRRWFINAGEKRSFEDKVRKGEIRQSVLEFRDTTDADPQDAQDSIDKKESDKKTALKDGVAAKAEGDAKKLADSKKTKEELAAEKLAAEDEGAKKKAVEGAAEADKNAADAKAGKPADDTQAGAKDKEADKK